MFARFPAELLRHRAANPRKRTLSMLAANQDAPHGPGAARRSAQISDTPGRQKRPSWRGLNAEGRISKGNHVAYSQTAEPTRRDFLYVATAAVGTLGAAATLLPLIEQMNPSADVLALASIEIDLTPIRPGQSVTFTWRSHPLFVRRRTLGEIEAARAVKVEDLLDPLARNANLPENAPATDDNRLTPNVNGEAAAPAAPGAGAAAKPAERPEWLVVVGVCTHLGCTPEASTPQARQGDYGGWLCHCHGSQYDVAGRVRVGPAPRNLDVPPYAFISDTRIKVG
jgi:ubiquinol-cytochrome c reductase iron-sulfur subunit